MEKRYLHVDACGRIVIPAEMRLATGMTKCSFVRAQLHGGIVTLAHVTPRVPSEMSEQDLLNFVKGALPHISSAGAKRVLSQLLESACKEDGDVKWQ